MEKLLNQAEINAMFRAAALVWPSHAYLPAMRFPAGLPVKSARSVSCMNVLPATDHASGAYLRLIFEVTWPPWVRFLSRRTHLDLVFLAAF